MPRRAGDGPRGRIEAGASAGGLSYGYDVVYSDPDLNAELRLFSGRTIDVPSLFFGDTFDWSTYSAPGVIDIMRTKTGTRMSGIEMSDGTGHWIQQEQPARLGTLLLAFAKSLP